MSYNGIQEFIRILKNNDQLDIIDEYVSPELEISEITDRYCKNNGKAILFNNTGTKFSVLTNTMGSEERICLALNVKSLNDFENEIKSLFHSFNKQHKSLWHKLKILPKLKSISSWMPVYKKGRGKCQQVVMESPDLTQIPILKTWPYDGGRFITLPIVHTIDPEDGKRNVGMYRMQVFSSDKCGMHWHRHKGGAKHFEKYKKSGKTMPVAVAIGGDPAYTYAATAPMPENFDEYMLAGFIRKKPVKLVRCISQDIHVPEDADFVIEGYIDPKEDFVTEGPFGDHTGFYSLADLYPLMHVTAITHRNDAVYPATIVGIPPQEDKWLGKATERIFLAPLQLTMLPEVIDMNLPVEGVFHNIVIIKLKKEYPGHAIKVMNSLWGAGQMMFSKIIITVNENTDVNNYLEIGKCIANNVYPPKDIHLSSGPMDVLDHAGEKPSYGGKMGIDATIKMPEELPLRNPDRNIKKFNSDRFAKKLISTFPIINEINTSLCESDINVVFISVEKNKKDIVSDIYNDIVLLEESDGLLAVVFTDNVADIKNVQTLIWRSANNFDPGRDILFPKGDNPVLGIDATRKTKKYDGFERPWPNIVVMDEDTINRIDEKWEAFGFKHFYSSPSKQFLIQQYKGNVVAKE